MNETKSKFCISPDDLAAYEESSEPVENLEDQQNPSRFTVARVEFAQETPDRQPSLTEHYGLEDGSNYDTQGQRTFGRNTLETLPHIDHYRNLLTTTGVMRKRPTLLELHDLELDEQSQGGIETAHLYETIDVDGKPISKDSGVKFGWIQGVLVRCVLNIFGVMLFLRISWVVGEAGIGLASVIILLSSLVTTLTTLSMSAICTNGEVKGGGAYYMISRSLGPEFGGAIGIVFSLANAVAVAMYVVGFAETIRDILLEHDCLMVDYINDVRIIGIITVFVLMMITLAGLKWEAKAQLVLLVILLLAIVNFMIGTFIPPSQEKSDKGFVGYSSTPRLYANSSVTSEWDIGYYPPGGYYLRWILDIIHLKWRDVIGSNFVDNFGPDFRGDHTFFSVFAIFFPAATGILAGANISGDLKDAQTSIPKGTLLSILITTITYLVVAWMAGLCVVRDAIGPSISSGFISSNNTNTTILYSMLTNISISETLSNDTVYQPNFTNLTEDVSLFNGIYKYGLLNDMQVMQMVSAFGPITIAGIVSATLSSALASLVSAPKVFQAVCKDKIFPFIHVFSIGYGKDNEPRRAYVLAFVLALACICIGELNAIAPLISNFFLMSYALVNYSCFDASLAKSPGWRPAFQCYSMWLSLAGAILCILVMFVISWLTALITIALVGVLFFYVHYKKPDINWGSSTQAHVYRFALQNTQKLVHINEHVKNFRPQILALSGYPSHRAPIVDFSSRITKDVGLMVCGHVILGKPNERLNDFRENSRQAYVWLQKRRTKSFYTAIKAESIRLGVQPMLQTVGLGKLKPNTMLIGFKSDWQTSPAQEVVDYFGIINDALDLRYGVGVLRLKSGLDFSHLMKNSSETKQPNGENLNPDACDSYYDVDKDEKDEKDDEDDEEEEEEEESGDEKNPKELKRMDKEDSPDIISKEDKFDRDLFCRKQGKGYIDVWWMFDDGGLTLLLPYLFSKDKNWKNCQLRIFMAGRKKSALDKEQRILATLLSKFRIKYSSIVVVPDVGRRPSDESISEFDKMIAEWMLNSQEGETELTHPGKISKHEKLAQNEKTFRHLRLRELLLEYSKDSNLIVMTLPMPRRGVCSAGLYMAWMDTLTRGMPPILLLRGNQESVLTFYS